MATVAEPVGRTLSLGAGGPRAWARAFLGSALVAGALGIASGCAVETEDPELVESVETTEASFTSQPGGGNRYDGLDDLQDAALKSALFEIVKNQTPLGYTRAKAAIFRTGLTPTSKLECIYTGIKVDPNGTTAPGGFNTEHSWPQSRGANREPAKSDLHHLFPSDARINSTRGNYLFGEVPCNDPGSTTTCSANVGGSALGRDDAGDLAFEVRPAKRGDIARAQFYFSIRYKLAIPTRTEATLKEWHAEDPADDEERFRNDKIEEQQNNRNPFIDRPDFSLQINDF